MAYERDTQTPFGTEHAWMNTTLTLMDLAGAIALLIWGVHMVQTDHACVRPAPPPHPGLRDRQPVPSLSGRHGCKRRYSRAARQPG